MTKPRVIAFYLPQYHPTPENDEWWGKGFTEWTNVAKAKPLFKGHYQPKIPADLGFYDLRLSESREMQAEYAKRAGVEAFCYWHYWFGEGKQMLNGPIDDVIKLQKPDFPFCLGWANHSWFNKSWQRTGGVMNLEKSKLLIEQKYPGKEDIVNHYNSLKHIFKDSRYYKVDGRLLFIVFNPKDIPNFSEFSSIWNELAIRDGLGGFHFVAHLFQDFEDCKKYLDIGYDAINLSLHHVPFSSDKFVSKKKGFRLFLARIKARFSIKPIVVNYDKAIIDMDSPLFEEERIYPTIIPNWDHTPRSGNWGRVFQNCTPKLFGQHVEQIFNRVKNKDDSRSIVFLKSWNEWGEGNYMEPDLKYGCQFIDMLKEKVDTFSK